MDAFFLIQQYEFIQSVTDQMLEASQVQDWQRVFELDTQRNQLLAGLTNDSVQTLLKKLDLENAEKIRQHIQTVLNANLVLNERAAVEKSNMQQKIHASHISSQLNRVYSSSL